MEDPLFLRLTIEHYRALLGTKLAELARANVQKLLIQAEDDLARAAGALPPAALAGRKKRRTETNLGE